MNLIECYYRNDYSHGTKHYKEIFEDKLAAKRKLIDDSQDQKQDPKALAKLNEMKGNTWER